MIMVTQSVTDQNVGKELLGQLKIREERCKSDKFPIFAFRMLPSSADMRHVPRSEGQES